jgi:hypothetical protein
MKKFGEMEQNGLLQKHPDVVRDKLENLMEELQELEEEIQDEEEDGGKRKKGKAR